MPDFLVPNIAAEDNDVPAAGTTGTFMAPKPPKMTRFDDGEPTLDLAAQVGGHEALRNASSSANRRTSLPSGEKRMPSVRTPGPAAARAVIAAESPMETDDPAPQESAPSSAKRELAPSALVAALVEQTGPSAPMETETTSSDAVPS